MYIYITNQQRNWEGSQDFCHDIEGDIVQQFDSAFNLELYNKLNTFGPESKAIQ